MMHHTKDKGDIATIKAIADLTCKGYYILTPTVSEHLPFDFIAYKENKFYRIQAKYSSDGFAKSGTSWADKNGSHKHKYNKNDFDYYAIYLAELDKIIYPSINFAGCTFTYNVPNSPTPFYWWEDFLEFTDAKTKRTYKDFGKVIRHELTEKVLQAQIARRKTNRPTKEELAKLLWEKPTTQLATDYNVSDTTILKWAKSYGLTKPPRGYWSKKH